MTSPPHPSVPGHTAPVSVMGFFIVIVGFSLGFYLFVLLFCFEFFPVRKKLQNMSWILCQKMKIWK